MPVRIRVALLAILCTCLGGCDAITGEDPDGPSTYCTYSYAGESAAADFGQACSTDDECAHGTCLMPGDDGNITNEVFGFCTRACDCESSDQGPASMAGSDSQYDCVYPGGCFVSQSQGAWRHAALKCNDVSDCTAVDPRYTHCASTNDMTVVDDTCGLHTVCQAHN